MSDHPFLEEPCQDSVRPAAINDNSWFVMAEASSDPK